MYQLTSSIHGISTLLFLLTVVSTGHPSYILSNIVPLIYTYTMSVNQYAIKYEFYTNAFLGYMMYSIQNALIFLPLIIVAYGASSLTYNGQLIDVLLSHGGLGGFSPEHMRTFKGTTVLSNTFIIMILNPIFHRLRRHVNENTKILLSTLSCSIIIGVSLYFIIDNTSNVFWVTQTPSLVPVIMTYIFMFPQTDPLPVWFSRIVEIIIAGIIAFVVIFITLYTDNVRYIILAINSTCLLIAFYVHTSPRSIPSLLLHNQMLHVYGLYCVDIIYLFPAYRQLFINENINYTGINILILLITFMTVTVMEKIDVKFIIDQSITNTGQQNTESQTTQTQNSENISNTDQMQIAVHEQVEIVIEDEDDNSSISSTDTI